MKYFFKSLPFRLVLGLAVGIVVGIFANEAVMTVIVPIKNVMNQVIMFCIPLIIIGFIAPSIVTLGSNATKLLGVALILAYVSSVCAAALSMLAGYGIIPNISVHSDPISLQNLPDDILKLQIPPIMSVMSALFLAVFIGLAVVWNKAKTWAELLKEFLQVVLSIVTKIVIPILPFYIGMVFCVLAYEGTITKQAPLFLSVVVIVLVGHFVWMTILYVLGGIYSGRNPLKVVKHYGPAYLTAVGTMSSAATLSVALECAGKAADEGTLRKDMVAFGVPLFANIHLCGSVLTETFFVMTVHMVLFGALPSIGTMILFILLLGIFAIGAPGVPGGTVMASLGIIVSVVVAASPDPGAADAFTGLMLAIFAIQDSFGTACNVTSDGALTLMLTGYAEKHKLEEQSQIINL